MVTLRESCLFHFTGSSKCSAMNVSKEDMSLCRRRILSADFRLVKLVLPQQPNSVSRPRLRAGIGHAATGRGLLHFAPVSLNQDGPFGHAYVAQVPAKLHTTACIKYPPKRLISHHKHICPLGCTLNSSLPTHVGQ